VRARAAYDEIVVGLGCRPVGPWSGGGRRGLGRDILQVRWGGRPFAERERVGVVEALAVVVAAVANAAPGARS
jgi:hypothetical protein